MGILSSIGRIFKKVTPFKYVDRSDLYEEKEFYLKVDRRHNAEEYEHIVDLWNKHGVFYVDMGKKYFFPSWVLFGIDYRESDCNMSENILNGEKLNRVTSIAPKGYGPFTDKEHSIRVMNLIKGKLKPRVDKVGNWLQFCELYNGLGYQMHGCESPYLWAGSDFYTGGLYIRDGVFSKTKKDERYGIASIISILLIECPDSFEKIYFKEI